MMVTMATDAAMDCEGLLKELGAPFERGVALGPLTWYGVGGSAQVLARPVSVQQLSEIVRRCAESQTPLRVLGKGANLLVPEGVVGGVVVLLDAPVFRDFRVGASGATAGGGANLEQLITATVREGLAGLENLAGIPATVGGALRMNAGGKFGQIGDYVASVTVVDVDGSVVRLARESLEFGYRHSNLGERIVVEAEFALTSVADKAALRKRLIEIMQFKSQSQPMGARSAGCAFKNPRSQSDKGAGMLIEEAGLKGFRIGGAEVSPRHANFVVLHQGGAARDVLAVMDHVTEEVQKKMGVTLQREVVVWE